MIGATTVPGVQQRLDIYLLEANGKKVKTHEKREGLGMDSTMEHRKGRIRKHGGLKMEM